MRSGSFITFEGGEGTGKSTQVRRLAARLAEAGQEVVVTREPGGSPGAEEIRALLVRGAVDRWSTEAEALLLYAARSDHLDRVIRPALARGAWVVCDRFSDSTRAYQGADASPALLGALEKEVVGSDRPDLTFLLDLPAEAGLARATARGEARTRFEAKDAAYHERLRQAFLEIARADPGRCVVVDARPSADAVAEAVWDAVRERVGPVSDTPHPRDTFELHGAEPAEAAWLEAVDRGRLHHAWLLAGPEGVGKATFAHRAARRLLGARPDPSRGLLGSDPADPVSRLTMARSHPDLLVLERGAEDSKSKRAILIDDARRLPEFFSKSPSIAPWRVAIIDTADDLTNEAANAVLKTLEEPPARGVLLLLSHSPGRLLPTLRSRCRRLNFAPWLPERISAFLQRRPGLDEAAALRLAVLSCGAPGRALALAQAGALELDEAAGELLASGPGAGARIQGLADRLRGGEGPERFSMITLFLAERLRAAAEDVAETDPVRAERLAALWERVANLPGDVEALNLDRAEALWTTAAELRAAAR